MIDYRKNWVSPGYNGPDLTPTVYPVTVRRAHETRSQMSGVQDERPFGLPGKSYHPVSSEIAAVAPAKVHVGNRNENGGDEYVRTRRRRR